MQITKVNNGLILQMSAAFRLDQNNRIPHLNYTLILVFPELTRSYSDLSHPDGHSQIAEFSQSDKGGRDYG